MSTDTIDYYIQSHSLDEWKTIIQADLTNTNSESQLIMIPTLYKLSTGKELSDKHKQALTYYSNILQSIRLDQLASDKTPVMSGGKDTDYKDLLVNITLSGLPDKKEGTIEDLQYKLQAQKEMKVQNDTARQDYEAKLKFLDDFKNTIIDILNKTFTEELPINLRIIEEKLKKLSAAPVPTPTASAPATTATTAATILNNNIKLLLLLFKLFIENNKLSTEDSEIKEKIIERFADKMSEVLSKNITTFGNKDLNDFLQSIKLKGDELTNESKSRLSQYLYLEGEDKDKYISSDEIEKGIVDSLRTVLGNRVSFYEERDKNPANFNFVKNELDKIDYDYNEAKRLKAEPIQAIIRLLSIIPPPSLKIFLSELAATERNEPDLRNIGAVESNGGSPIYVGGDIQSIFNQYITELANKYTELQQQIDTKTFTKLEADALDGSIKALDSIATNKLPPLFTTGGKSSGGDGSSTESLYENLNNINRLTSNINVKATKPDNIGKLSQINSKLSEISGGDMYGGVDPIELPKDQTSITKETVKELDDMKRTIRELIANTTGYQNRFDKFVTNVNGQQEKLNKEKENNNGNPYAIASGLYQYLQDEGKNLNTDIQSKITTDKKALQDVVTKINKLLDSEPPTVKLFRDARMKIREYMTGVQSDGTEKPETGLETLYPTIVGTIKGYYEDNYAKIKTDAEGLKKEREYKLEEKRAEQRQGLLALQAANPEKKQGGKPDDDKKVKSTDPKDIIKETVDTIKANLTGILDNILVPISNQYTKRLNPTLMAVSSTSPPTLFQSIYNRYLDEVTDDPYRATERLSESMRTNHLVPKEVLEVTRNDRLIFIFITLIIRLFGVNVTNWMIDKDYITTLRSTFISYLALYTLFIILFVTLVNLDLYRMRIIFNYVNLHANRGRIFTHLAALWVFAFFIYLYFIAISKLNKTSPFTPEAPYSLSEEDKARLQHKVQMFSIILWLLLVMLIALV